MKKYTWLTKPSIEDSESGRRNFIRNMILFGFGSGFGPDAGSAFHKGNEVEEVTPSEDLMREHGLLSRILLIYDLLQFTPA